MEIIKPLSKIERNILGLLVSMMPIPVIFHLYGIEATCAFGFGFAWFFLIDIIKIEYQYADLKKRLKTTRVKIGERP